MNPLFVETTTTTDIYTRRKIQENARNSPFRVRDAHTTQ